MKKSSICMTLLGVWVLSGPWNVALAEATAGFHGHLNLLQSISLTNQKDLDFGDVMRPLSGSVQVTVSPDDPGAAVFRATGEPLRSVEASITTPTVVLANDSDTSDTIEVTDFTLGGSLQDQGNGSGTANFDPEGVINHMTVGGTAMVNSENQPGDYTGNATFRLVYQ